MAILLITTVLHYYIRLAQVAQFALDMIFVIDASRSIGSVIFAQTKFFVSRLIDYLGVDDGHVRVGACSYSSEVISSFNLNAHTTVVGVKAAVLSLSYSGGSSNTAGALAYVRRTMLTSAAGDRSDVPNVVVIFTDGPSADPQGARVSAAGEFIFLPRDATQSAVMRLHVVCPSVWLSVCPSVTLRYVFHTGWNTSKIIA